MPHKSTKKTAATEETWVHAICNRAENGAQIRAMLGDPKPKTIWTGGPTESGLHNHGDSVITKKWAKSGARFTTKVAELIAARTTVLIFEFRRINRDRVKWVRVKTYDPRFIDCRCRVPKEHSDCCYCGTGTGIQVCGACADDGIDGRVIRGTSRVQCKEHKAEREARRIRGGK